MNEFEKVLRREFSGPDNARLRALIRTKARRIPVGNLARRLGLSACGEASLMAVEEAQKTDFPNAFPTS